MTLDEFRNKVNQLSMTEEDKTLCLFWYEHCNGKKVAEIAEQGDADKILTTAKRFYGRVNSTPKKKEKKVELTIDYDFTDIKKAIKAASYDELSLWTKSIDELKSLVELQIANKEFQAYLDKKKEAEQLIKELNKMRDDVKIELITNTVE